MTYATEVAAISRTPITMVQIAADYCSRTFGTSPCLATGTKCYNTRMTCVYTTAYSSTTKVYRFTSHDVPVPWGSGERPYMISVKLMPTEMTEVRSLVTRATIELADEPDSDIGIDPYVSSRSSVQGTYWKKWLARNPNFKGRPLQILEGFTGLTSGEFTSKFSGTIQSIEFGNNKVIIEAADLNADLSDTYWPVKVDVKLTFDLSTSDSYLHVTNASQLAAAPGYVRIDDEVIKYTTRDTTANFVTGLTRGAFGTVNVAHTAGRKVTRVGYLAEDYTSNQIIFLLLDVGLSASTQFNAAVLSFIWSTPNFVPPKHPLIVVEPRKVSELLAELCELAELHYWIGEGSIIDFKRKLPNEPARTFSKHFTDQGNIVDGSVVVDTNDEKRITRLYFWWDHDCIHAINERTSFNRGDIIVDAEAELIYGEATARDMYSQVMRYAVTYTDVETHIMRVVNLLSRILAWNVKARAEIDFQVELKDSTVTTGDYVTISTNQVQGIDGVGLSQAQGIVVRRERGKGNLIDLRVRLLPTRKFAYIAPDASPDWSSADGDDKQYAFISNNPPNAGKMDAIGTDGYYIM